ncbi:MAG: hypothetical protein COT85_02465 [Chlamydiae bacterium CG10_big_fil_rev_8_21_14_0_10_42_34]|nr:MAG: hypothetical protein COT85_02465 [Chlamydiae bacterium CG10_big_fil_rev_8_21_14_0_10_42_34]
MKSYLFILSGICVAGCMTSNGLQYQAMSDTNLYHIAKINKGMSEREVLQIMHKPYSYESFQVKDDIYDVWFYVTRATGLDQTRMVPQNLTPLTFKNGVLVGTGYYWYYYAMKAEADEVAEITPPPPKPKTHEVEDIEFEKALRPEPNQHPKTQTKSPSTLIPAGPNSPQKQVRKKAPLEIPEPKEVPTHTTEAPCNPCKPQTTPKDLVYGMNEEQAVHLYGKPTKTDSFVFNGDIYDIFYFDTIPSKTGATSIIPQHQTPAVFRNQAFIGMSEDRYFKLKCRACAKTADILPTEMQAESEISSQEPLAKRQSMHKVQIGMTETEVTNIAGSPNRYETYRLDEDIYDIWFYQNKPPLTFKNSVLVGTTSKYYRQIRLRAEKEGYVNGYNREADRMQEDASEQDFNFW